MAFYDVAGGMQFGDPLQALMRGYQGGQQAQEMRRQQMVRQGLQQFWRPATPEQAQFVPKQGGLAALAATPDPVTQAMSGGIPSVSPARSTGSMVGPELEKRVTPGTAASFDYQGAQDWLAKQGDFTTLAELAKARTLTQPEAAKWTGAHIEGIDEQGKPAFYGLTSAGPQRIQGITPRPAAAKAPQTREINVGNETLTQEWDGFKYVTVAKAPRSIEKPEKVDPRDNLNLELKLGDRYQREAASFREVRQARDNVVNSLGQNTAAGDLAAATAIMKMLDPGSVVRESELGMAMNATGAVDRLGNYAQMIQNGQRLNPQQRAEFQALAASLYGTAEKYHNQTKQRFTSMAQQYNLDPYNIIGERPGEAQAGQGGGSAPAVPEAAIRTLRNNPKLRDQFDAKYGVGAASRYLGK